VTAEGQAEWDERVPILLSIKAKMRFVSIEPILEPINIVLTRPSPDWIQCGPETGVGKRSYDPKWIELICRDCRKMGIRFFDKQNPPRCSREWPESWQP
jgi:protein gp37